MLKKYFLHIVVVILLITIAWMLLLIKKDGQLMQADISQNGTTVLKLPTTEENVFFPIRNWAIEEPEISAKSAIIVNSQPSQKDVILYQKNIHQVLPIASLTKIMTAIVALENYNPEEIIKVFKTSEELTIKDLLYLMLVESNNDAAISLASDDQKLNYEKFIELMNSEAKQMGLANTSFVDSVGLSACNQSTTSEIAALAKSAMSSPLLMEIISTPETTVFSIDKKFIHKITSTNKLLGKIPQLIGGKTGYTDEAGGCMMTLSKISNNNYLITVVLGSTQRESDIEQLIAWAQKAWLWK